MSLVTVNGSPCVRVTNRIPASRRPRTSLGWRYAGLASMPIDTAYLRERYASLRDDQLQRLRSVEYEQLSSEAQQALREEIDRREALKPKPAWLGQPCPSHPESEVATVCARCGRFLCKQCVADPHTGSVCSECQQRLDSEPWKFNPWLGLAFVGLFVPLLSFLVYAFALGSYFFAGVRSRGLTFAPTLLFGWALLSNLGLSCLSVLIIPKYWRKLRAVPRWMLGYYFASLAIGAVDIALSVIVPGGFMGSPRALVGVVITGLWISYFSASERVRRTFIR